MEDLKEKVLKEFYWEDEELKLLKELDIESYDWLEVRNLVSELGLSIDVNDFLFKLDRAVKGVLDNIHQSVINQAKEMKKTIESIIDEHQSIIDELEGLSDKLDRIIKFPPKNLNQYKEILEELDHVECEIWQFG